MVILAIIISTLVGVAIGVFTSQYCAANAVVTGNAKSVRDKLVEIHDHQKYLSNDEFVKLFNELYYGDTVKIDDGNREVFTYRAIEELTNQIRKAPWLFRTYFKYKG